MEPKKSDAWSSSSSKPLRRSAAAKWVNSGKLNECCTAAKKRKAAAPPPLPATPPPAPTTVYVLMKSEAYAFDESDSYEPPTNSIEGVYYSEDQAYAAAIRKIVSGYESELRNIATSEGLPLRERMDKIRATGLRIYEGDEFRFRVKKSRLFPTEIVDDGKLLDGLNPINPLQSNC